MSRTEPFAELVDLTAVNTVWDDYTASPVITAMLKVRGGYQVATFPPSKKPPRVILGEFPTIEETEEYWEELFPLKAKGEG